MTTPIKTQCPSCHTCFELSEKQLGQPETKARCGRCKQVFTVNEHLLVLAPASEAVTSIDIDDLDSDRLIYDDMDIEANTEKVNGKSNIEPIFDSLDEMQAWLTELKPTTIHSTKDTTQSNKHNYSNSNRLANDGHKNWNLSDCIKQLSDANSDRDYAYPSPHANIVNDEAVSNTKNVSDLKGSASSQKHFIWLEDRLKEKRIDYSEPSLNRLLSDMGVNIATAQNNNVQTQAISHLAAKQRPPLTRAQTSIATLLWSLGSLVLVLLLFAQYITFNLNTLVKNPVYAQHLQSLCTLVVCSLPYADIDAFQITDLNYLPSQISSPVVFSDIKASLVNQSDYSQILPSLKVSIHGNNALIGEFIAMPEDYLLSPQNQLASHYDKSVMFTIPIAIDQINKVVIDPIY